MADKVTVVDARMGRGKSSAAIRYMNEHKGRRFIYATPFLSEVERVCNECGFAQPISDSTTKSADLKRLISMGASAAISHSLLTIMDDDALFLVESKGYSLIIDESVETISRTYISEGDIEAVCNHFATIDDDGFLKWKDSAYSGVFSPLKEVADAGYLKLQDTVLIQITNPRIFYAFKEVFMLTYLFSGQFQKAYLDSYGIDYEVVGVEKDEHGFQFSDKPDDPGPFDYYKLIHIIDDKSMNKVGSKYHALSKSWYSARKKDNEDISQLRRSMAKCLRDNDKVATNERLWTCFKSDVDKLDPVRRFRSQFLQCSARATNSYSGCTSIAYMVNRFVDPNMEKFFANNGATVDRDMYALSEMLQFIWRSAIRNGQPIKLYIPSKRMRGLLTQWMDSMKKGDRIDDIQLRQNV